MVRQRLGESEKSVTNIGDKNTTVLELVVPFDFTNKHDVTAYRYHEEAVTLTKLLQRPETDFVDGTFYLDQNNGLIYIYASQFSTYAIGYEEGAALETPEQEQQVDPLIKDDELLSPPTGSHTHEMTWFMVLMMSFVVFYQACRYRRRMNK